MRPFKLPLIVTGIAFTLALVIVIAASAWVYQSETSNRRKVDRAQKIGSGVGIATCMVIAPFWFFAAAKVGKQRRAAREARKAIR